MTDHADLTVHSLHGSIRQSPLQEAPDSGPVILQCPSKSLEGVQFGPPSTREPVLEFALGMLDGPTREHALEGLLQEVRAVESLVGCLDTRQLVLVMAREIPRVFQKRPPACFQLATIVSLHGPELRP